MPRRFPRPASESRTDREAARDDEKLRMEEVHVSRRVTQSKVVLTNSLSDGCQSQARGRCAVEAGPGCRSQHRLRPDLHRNLLVPLFVPGVESCAIFRDQRKNLGRNGSRV